MRQVDVQHLRVGCVFRPEDEAHYRILVQCIQCIVGGRYTMSFFTNQAWGVLRRVERSWLFLGDVFVLLFIVGRRGPAAVGRRRAARRAAAGVALLIGRRPVAGRDGLALPVVPQCE